MENDITGDTKTRELDDAAACGKLWEIYAKEAQEYDSGLVKSWKEDMDSILVFSGLYSAILTAFIIESYQNLQPDPADNSAVLLKRISQQLATPSNSSGLTPFPDDEAFSPAPSALACNILWFISLGLALTCAFLATLVQQWSRRFLHRTSRSRSPGVHAHLLQYLYFGLKDQKMDAIVDLIPSLLHLSLFSFFAGLIGFLYEVNNVLTWLFAGALGLVLIIYFTFTLLPSVYLNSPYSTPLSPVLWRMRKFIKAIPHSRRIQAIWIWLSRLKQGDQGHNPNEIGTRPQNDEETQLLPLVRVTENITPPDLSLIDASLQESKTRRPSYESRCITWTLTSLNDDTELLPFLEALPHVLLGDDLDSVREGNLHLMTALLASRDTQTGIVSRTLSLMENSKNSWHDEKHRERCATAGARTLYALARVLADQKYRRRFTGSAKCPSPFTAATLARMGKDTLFSTAESESFSNSLSFLCILSVLQSLDDNIQACTDQLIPHSWFQEANMLLEDHLFVVNWDQTWMRGSENEFSREQAKTVIGEMISVAFLHYLHMAVGEPSFNLVCIRNLLVQNGSDPFQAGHGDAPGSLFIGLCSPFDHLNHTLIERLNTIFGIALDGFLSPTSITGSEIERESASKSILDYIAIRFRTGGWGSTKKIWSESGRLLRLLDYLQKSAASLDNVSDSALQELLLHATDIYKQDDIVKSFLEHSFSRIHSQAKKENTPRSHLWFLLAITILSKFQYWNREAICPILKLINEELDLDPVSKDIFTRSPIEYAYIESAYIEISVILHCLNSKLPAQETRDILQLFFSCCSGYYEVILPRPSLNVLNELVQHSEHFVAQFLQAPSKEMMDITALVWRFWGINLPESTQDLFLPDTESEQWQVVRSGLLSLSNSASKLLTSEGRKTVAEITKFTPQQEHTILPDWKLRYLNLLGTVELVQRRVTMILKEIDRFLDHPPTLTSLSSPNPVDQGTESAIAGHNTNQATNLPK